MAMKQKFTFAMNAVLTLAEITVVAKAFEQGEINVLDALDAVTAAIEAYEVNAQPIRKAA